MVTILGQHCDSGHGLLPKPPEQTQKHLIAIITSCFVCCLVCCYPRSICSSTRCPRLSSTPPSLRRLPAVNVTQGRVMRRDDSTFIIPDMESNITHSNTPFYSHSNTHSNTPFSSSHQEPRPSYEYMYRTLERIFLFSLEHTYMCRNCWAWTCSGT